MTSKAESQKVVRVPVRGPGRRHRTIFISDTHLGTRTCKAKALADFLMLNDCDTLYLIGDIVDGWHLKGGWHWTDAQTRVIELIVAKAKAGTRVIYVPGNHDEMFRPYCGLSIAGIEVKFEDVHETADGRKLLVVHGDHFDGIVPHARRLAAVGAQAYGAVVALNKAVNGARKKLRLPQWSMAAYVKRKVKDAGQYVVRFERAVAAEAKLRGFDGVVCGHIHHADLKHIDGVLYANDGDWVESCTAMAEDAQGRLSILRWAGAKAGEPESVAAAA